MPGCETGAGVPALAHAFAHAERGWRASTDTPDLASRFTSNAWNFTLSADRQWLGVILLDDGTRCHWAKLSATLAAAVQMVSLTLTTHRRFDVRELRIGLNLGGYYYGSASLMRMAGDPCPTGADTPVVVPCLQSGATVRFGTWVDLARLRVDQGWSAGMMLVAEEDTESRWRGQWRVRPEIPGDCPPGLACLRQWRLTGEAEARGE